MAKIVLKGEDSQPVETMKGQTVFYCALVFKAPLKTYESVRDYLLKFSDAELIFQTKSVDYLWVVKAPPKYAALTFEDFVSKREVEKCHG